MSCDAASDAFDGARHDYLKRFLPRCRRVIALDGFTPADDVIPACHFLAPITEAERRFAFPPSTPGSSCPP